MWAYIAAKQVVIQKASTRLKLMGVTFSVQQALKVEICQLSKPLVRLQFYQANRPSVTLKIQLLEFVLHKLDIYGSLIQEHATIDMNHFQHYIFIMGT